MVELCWSECDNGNAAPRGYSDQPSAGIWVFSWLMGALLVLGVCANIYIIWVTTRPRFSVRWNTFRLILRYTSVVDMSLLVVLAALVFRSAALFHTKIMLELSIQCAPIDLNGIPYAGGIAVAGGVVIAARQTIMLVTFDQEVNLLRQHRSRTANLAVDIAIFGVMCFLATIALSQMGPVVDLQICYVTGPITSKAIYMFVVPVIVSAIISVFLVSSPFNSDNKHRLHVNQKLSCSGMSNKQLMASSDNEGIEDSRWNRLIISAHVACLSWFVLAAAMAVAGLLIEPVSVHTFVSLTGTSVMISVWSAYSVVRHWS